MRGFFEGCQADAVRTVHSRDQWPGLPHLKQVLEPPSVCGTRAQGESVRCVHTQCARCICSASAQCRLPNLCTRGGLLLGNCSECRHRYRCATQQALLGSLSVPRKHCLTPACVSRSQFERVSHNPCVDSVFASSSEKGRAHTHSRSCFAGRCQCQPQLQRRAVSSSVRTRRWPRFARSYFNTRCVSAALFPVPRHVQPVFWCGRDNPIQFAALTRASTPSSRSLTRACGRCARR